MAPAQAQEKPDSLDLAKMSQSEIAAAIAARMQAFRRAHNLPEDRPIYERPVHEQPRRERAADMAAPPPAPSAPDLRTAAPETAEAAAPEAPAKPRSPRPPRPHGAFSGDFARIIAESNAPPHAAPAATVSAAMPALVIPPDLRRTPAAGSKRQVAKHTAASPSAAAKVLIRMAIVAAIGAVLWVAWPMRGGDAPLRPATLTPNLEALQDAADELAGAPAPEVPQPAFETSPDTAGDAAPDIVDQAAPNDPTLNDPAGAASVADMPEAPAPQVPPDLDPAREATEARATDSPPQAAPTPTTEAALAPIAPQAETVAPAPIHKPETEPFTPVARPFVPESGDATPKVATPDAATPAPKPTAKPLTLQPGPYTPTAKPFVPAGETPFQPKPKPFVPSAN